MNANELTKKQAVAEIRKLADKIALENSLDFIPAWNRAKEELPEVAKIAFSGDPENLADFRYTRRPANTALANGADYRAPARSRPQVFTTPLPNAENIAALCLPNDATYEEFKTALEANGGVVPLRPERKRLVFDALAGLNLFNKCGTDAAAKKIAAARFPKLVS